MDPHADPIQDGEGAEEFRAFAAEWDRQFAALSPEDKQAIVANPMCLLAFELQASVNAVLRMERGKGA